MERWGGWCSVGSETHCREQNSSSVASAICHRTPVPLLRCNVYLLSVYILSRSSLLMFSSVLVFPEGLYVFDFQDNEAMGFLKSTRERADPADLSRFSSLIWAVEGTRVPSDMRRLRRREHRLYFFYLLPFCYFQTACTKFLSLMY